MFPEVGIARRMDALSHDTKMQIVNERADGESSSSGDVIRDIEPLHQPREEDFRKPSVKKNMLWLTIASEVNKASNGHYSGAQILQETYGYRPNSSVASSKESSVETEEDSRSQTDGLHAPRSSSKRMKKNRKDAVMEMLNEMHEDMKQEN
ncbi:hypothetical protein DPMN_030109 [Dreissena polymorpha]|uniref:Uncharacterized protein n=1 Tax=Dreissena polymorpha TaxID=45954 RepID=A0A9D4RHZ8_DREPO|nr:hypothetical protein DPMN_030109 [Dreissena polymorpha]